ncbi:hypothetical protein [Paenibacillus sp. 1P07SE]|uniref:hypothetical protein n=1 Tax=Paenibacillus sp. 1P07SE TaxID=3132209 RepID=UPI0039A48636
MTASLADGQWNAINKQLIAHATESVLEQGMTCFRGGMVRSVEPTAEDRVYGFVADERILAVILDLDHLGYSKCTCEADMCCKHLIAVWYAFCARLGIDPQSVHEHLKRGEIAGYGTPQRERDGRERPSSPGEEGGVAAWRAWFQEVYGEVWQQCRQSLHPMQSVLSEMKGSAKYWDKARQRYHWLHTIEFVLEQVELAYAATDSYSRYYYEMSFTRSVDPWIAHFHELTESLSFVKLTPWEESWLEALIEALRTMALAPEPSLLRWDRLYHLIWERLAAEQTWRQTEQQKLEALLGHNAGLEKRQLTFIQAAMAHFDVVAYQDEEAVDRLRDVDFDRIADLVYSFADQRLEERAWGAFRRWMDYLHEQLADCRNAAILRPYLALCRQADVRQPEAGRLWSERMIALLPHAYAELSEHWLERADYEAWADLQLFIGARPQELDVQDLRAVARHAPSVLIPLYHQAVDEAILSRNRQGYRNAVKLMKKLEKLYQADGRHGQWESFVDHLSHKYQRLRALQEELWKGKVVT